MKTLMVMASQCSVVSSGLLQRPVQGICLDAASSLLVHLLGVAPLLQADPPTGAFHYNHEPVRGEGKACECGM